MCFDTALSDHTLHIQPVSKTNNLPVPYRTKHADKTRKDDCYIDVIKKISSLIHEQTNNE